MWCVPTFKKHLEKGAEEDEDRKDKSAKQVEKKNQPRKQKSLRVDIGLRNYRRLVGCVFFYIHKHTLIVPLQREKDTAHTHLLNIYRWVDEFNIYQVELQFYFSLYMKMIMMMMMRSTETFRFDDLFRKVLPREC